MKPRLGVPLGEIRIAGVLLVGWLAIALGCASSSNRTPLMAQAPNVVASAEELRLRGNQFGLRFYRVVEKEADRIMSESSDPEVRRRALLWKMHAIPACQEAVFQPDPLAALVDVWALCAQMTDYFETGEGKDAFGPQQGIAIDASRRLEAEVDGITRAATATGHPQKVKALFEEWVKENPIEGSTFVRRSTVSLLADVLGQKETSTLSALAAVDESMTDLMDRITVYAEYLPRQGRWQAELLMMETAGREEIRTATARIAALADSVERSLRVFEELPETVDDQRLSTLEALREERVAVLEEVDRQRVATLDVLKAELETILEAVGREREALMDAVTLEREAVMEALSAERVAVMKDVEALSTRAIEETSIQLEGLIDQAFVRAAQLLGAFVAVVAVLLGLFKLLARKENR